MTYRRALLRFERADERLLIRAAAECHDTEFERIARHLTRRVLRVAATELNWAHQVLDEFRAACTSEIVVAPPTLWAPLFDAPDAGLRERALGLLMR